VKITSLLVSVTRTKIKHFANLLLIGVFTLTSVSSVASQDKYPNQNKTFLWKVESQDNTIYLLGSVHFLKKENYPLPKSMQQAFNDAEIVVFETNLAQATSSATVIIEKAMLPPGETLRTYLSESNYQIVENKSQNIGFPLDNFQSFKPWFLATAFVGFGFQSLGFQPQYGVDFYFFHKAKEAGKQILALETLEKQLSLFDNFNKKEQEMFLLQSIMEFENIENFLNIMLESWSSGNVDKFENIILQSFEDFPEFRNKLLAQRNKNWLSEIKIFLTQDRDYLVIVGAAHLVGNDGLLKLLQKEGYSVEQL
jgi:uncharacterized protein YbaP (TraB family)